MSLIWLKNIDYRVCLKEHITKCKTIIVCHLLLVAVPALYGRHPDSAVQGPGGVDRGGVRSPGRHLEYRLYGKGILYGMGINLRL